MSVAIELDASRENAVLPNSILALCSLGRDGAAGVGHDAMPGSLVRALAVLGLGKAASRLPGLGRHSHGNRDPPGNRESALVVLLKAVAGGQCITCRCVWPI